MLMLPDTDYSCPRRNKLWLSSVNAATATARTEARGKALAVDTITIPSHRLVEMPEACARGHGTQQCWADAACAAVLLCCCFRLI